jgi:hypothetical protein
MERMEKAEEEIVGTVILPPPQQQLRRRSRNFSREGNRSRHRTVNIAEKRMIRILHHLHHPHRWAAPSSKVTNERCGDGHCC